MKIVEAEGQETPPGRGNSCSAHSPGTGGDATMRRFCCLFWTHVPAKGLNYPAGFSEFR